MIRSLINLPKIRMAWLFTSINQCFASICKYTATNTAETVRRNQCAKDFQISSQPHFLRLVYREFTLMRLELIRIFQLLC